MAKDKKDPKPQPDQAPEPDDVQPVEGDDREKYLPDPEVQASGTDRPEAGERPAEQPKPPKP
jgi:hypothetical protein